MLIKQNTWPALELLKALAIISMIILHSWGWIITDDELVLYQSSWEIKLGNLLHFFCFFDLWIPALAGASLYIQFQPSLSDNKKGPARIAFDWAAILLVSGFLFEVFLNNSLPLMAYNPLHFLGYSFLLISLLLRLTPHRYFSLWTLCFLVLSLLKDHYVPHRENPPSVSYEAVFNEGYLQVVRFYLDRMLFAYPIAGWAMIPWFSSILLGYSFSEFYFRHFFTPRRLNILIFLSGILSFTLLFQPTSTAFIRTQNLLAQTSALMMPTSLFISCLCGFLFLLSLFSWFFLRTSKNLPEYLVIFSRGSFWIFFIHFALGYVFTPFFTSFNLPLKIFIFPIFILAWSGLWGYFILELSKKRLKVTFKKP